MRNVSPIATILGILLLAACGDTSGPTIDGALSAAKGGKGHGVGNQNGRTVVVVTDADADGYTTNEHSEHPESYILRHSTDAPPLENHRFTFWAVKGVHSTLQVNYLPDGAGHALPLLKVKFHRNSLDRWADGTPMASGDSVQIEVELVGTKFLIRMGPSGLEFRHAVEITVWYANAELDLNGDGVVDDADRELEEQYLTLMYQEHNDDPWLDIGAVHSIDDQSFRIDVDHFSNYAVGW